MANQIEALANLTYGLQTVVVPGVDLTSSGITAGKGLYKVGEQERYDIASPPTFDGTDTTITLTGVYQGDTATNVQIVIQLSYTVFGIPIMDVNARNGGAIVGTLAKVVDSVFDSLITGTRAFTNLLATGGNISGLSSLSVAANSGGNVARWAMTTSNSSSGSTGYWAKLATITPPANNYQYMGLTIRISDTYGYNSGFADVFAYITQKLAGLDTVESHISVVQNDSKKLSHDSFRLVGSATNGADIELWVRIDMDFARFAVYVVSQEATIYDWSVTYHHDAAWQATAPTGTVVVNSDWAGSGWINGPTITGAGWGIVSQPAYRKKANGDVEARGIVSIGTMGVTILTYPVGYRPGNISRYFVCAGNNGGALRGYVDTSGNFVITHNPTSATSVAMDTLRWLAES